AGPKAPQTPASPADIAPVHDPRDQVTVRPNTTPPRVQAMERRYPTRERNPPRYLMDFESDRRYSRNSVTSP
ncbi:Hypothetical predicted protein, partial [Xyrichtys novacula]